MSPFFFGFLDWYLFLSLDFPRCVYECLFCKIVSRYTFIQALKCSFKPRRYYTNLSSSVLHQCSEPSGGASGNGGRMPYKRTNLDGAAEYRL